MALVVGAFLKKNFILFDLSNASTELSSLLLSSLAVGTYVRPFASRLVCSGVSVFEERFVMYLSASTALSAAFLIEFLRLLVCLRLRLVYTIWRSGLLRGRWVLSEAGFAWIAFVWVQIVGVCALWAWSPSFGLLLPRGARSHDGRALIGVGCALLGL